MAASNISNGKATWFQPKQGIARLAIHLTQTPLFIAIQDIIAGVIYIVTRIMCWDNVLKVKSPALTGLFMTYAKIGFAIPGCSNNPRIAQPRSFFQLPSSLKSIVNGVIHV